MTPVDVIVRQEDGAWSAWSPTAPGFYASDEGYERLNVLVRDGLRRYFDGAVVLVQHNERLLPDELVLRVCFDGHRDDRIQVAERLERAQWLPAQAEEMRRTPRNDLGEHVVVCTVPSDTIGFVVRQMAPNDMLYVGTAVADELVLTFRLTNTQAPGSSSLAALGLTLDSPVGDLVKLLPIEGSLEANGTLVAV